MLISERFSGRGNAAEPTFEFDRFCGEIQRETNETRLIERVGANDVIENSRCAGIVDTSRSGLTVRVRPYESSRVIRDGVVEVLGALIVVPHSKGSHVRRREPVS